MEFKRQYIGGNLEAAAIGQNLGLETVIVTARVIKKSRGGFVRILAHYLLGGPYGALICEAHNPFDDSTFLIG